MASYNNYIYRDGFLSQLSAYKIIISTNEYLRALDRINNNQVLVSEFVGTLLGRAYPIYIKVPCKICKKDIEEPEAIEQEITETLEACHKDCYEEYKKKNE